jgi:hypothetical protein
MSAPPVLDWPVVTQEEQEHWAPVFADLYEASSLGRIRRLAPGKSTWPGRVLSQRINNRYYQVMLSFDGLRRNIEVHTLVAMAFLGERPLGHDVNHIDANPLNNRLANLEYVTRTGNMQHASRMGRLRSKVTPDMVRAIRVAADGAETHREIGRRFGLSRPQTSKIINGDSWRSVQ